MLSCGCGPMKTASNFDEKCSRSALSKSKILQSYKPLVGLGFSTPQPSQWAQRTFSLDRVLCCYRASVVNAVRNCNQNGSTLFTSCSGLDSTWCTMTRYHWAGGNYQLIVVSWAARLTPLRLVSVWMRHCKWCKNVHSNQCCCIC